MKKIENKRIRLAFLTKKPPKSVKAAYIDRRSGVSGRLLW